MQSIYLLFRAKESCMNSIILIGGGGHCKSCIDVIESEGKYAIAGILDSIKRPGELVLGYHVLGLSLIQICVVEDLKGLGVCWCCVV